MIRADVRFRCLFHAMQLKKLFLLANDLKHYREIFSQFLFVSFSCLFCFSFWCEKLTIPIVFWTDWSKSKTELLSSTWLIFFHVWGWDIHRIGITLVHMIFIWFTYIILSFQWRLFGENRYQHFKRLKVRTNFWNLKFVTSFLSIFLAIHRGFVRQR